MSCGYECDGHGINTSKHKKEKFGMKTLIRSFVIALGLITFAASSAWAGSGSVSIPNTFTAGTTAVADDVNDNFTAVEGAVNINDNRISDLEAVVSNLELTRTMSFPASALSFDSSDPITVDSSGLLWSFTYSGGATLTIRSPADYAGEDVTFHIFFQTTTSTAGVVNFFIRPTSFDSGEGQIDPGSVSGPSVAVSGSSGFGTLYEQRFNISASRLRKDWWVTTIQREGTGATYSDDVIVFGVAYEYLAAQ
jgi:hypothetical protein